jgi:hypothetical protein
MLLDTADELELVGPQISPTDLLVRLFHEETPRVFDAQPVKFGCTCSADRVRQSLSIYSAKDIGHMTTDEGIVTADCQFCGAHYEFDPRRRWGSRPSIRPEREMGRPIDLETVHRAVRAADAPSSDFDLNPGVVLPPGRKLRPAAVLIGVLGSEVILTKRASHLKHHPGQIAFPGGKVDDGRCRRARRRAQGSARGDRA